MCAGPESSTTETNNQHDTTREGAPELGATVRPIENQAQAAGPTQARRNLLGAMNATDAMHAMDYSKLSKAELDLKLATRNVPPTRTNMPAHKQPALAGGHVGMPDRLWGSLPDELTEFFVLMMLNLWCDKWPQGDNTDELKHVRTMRLINKTFASTWAPALNILCPTSHPKHAPFFVEGVIWFLCDRMSRQSWLTADCYANFYATVWKGATRNPKTPGGNHSERYYNALGAKLTAMIENGAIGPFTDDQRERMIKTLLVIFAVIDRFYVKRVSLPELKYYLPEAISIGEVAARVAADAKAQSRMADRAE